jgi:hypothetical protein
VITCQFFAVRHSDLGAVGLSTKKPNCTRSSFFGNSAIFVLKIRGFPPPPHGELGFIGEYVEILYLIKNALSFQ